jgi:hypothetical protein
MSAIRPRAGRYASNPLGASHQSSPGCRPLSGAGDAGRFLVDHRDGDQQSDRQQGNQIAIKVVAIDVETHRRTPSCGTLKAL